MSQTQKTICGKPVNNKCAVLSQLNVTKFISYLKEFHNYGHNYVMATFMMSRQCKIF